MSRELGICTIYSTLAPYWHSIKNLPIKFGLKMINHAIEKENEGKAWQMWLTQYPNMDKKTFKPFSQFLKEVCKPVLQVSRKSSDEILQEAYKIRQSLGK